MNSLNFRNGYEWRAVALLMLGRTSEATNWSEEYRDGYQAALLTLLNKFEATRKNQRDSERIVAVLDEWFR